ncbi:MAG: nitroreductase family protein [Spirochaetes bacterium]|jgi:nitroreductase|nr:nitroreductase family protein [Spirochaetota bacterium]
MELKEAIDARRAYRSFDPDPVPETLVHDVMERVRLAPSCFNNQPWRFVFVRSAGPLAAVKAALSRGNAWAQAAPMIVAVLSRRDLDCVTESPDRPAREYFLFDTGMATAYLQLLLTEAGLVAHPIAGYSESTAAEAVGAPEGMSVVSLVIVGRRSAEPSPLLSEKQRAGELVRPQRRPADELACIDRYPA